MTNSADEQCQRCAECSANSHHWLDNPDYGLDSDDFDDDDDDENPPDTAHSHVCKHCTAVGDECEQCQGDGAVIDDDGVEDFDCPKCEGEGVIRDMSIPIKVYRKLPIV